MSSAVDIQIVSAPNLEKIENFFNDASYRETIEYSASFNSRLCDERRLRLPFFDAQTGGVAQNSSQLFLNKRQRMPGFRQGQIYTYPAARWRKSRRQYLNRVYRFPERPFQALRKEHEAHMAGGTIAATFAPFGATSAASLAVIGGGSLGNGGNSIGISGIGIGASVAAGGNGYISTITHDTDFNGAALLEESSSLGAAGGDTSDSKDSQQHQQQQHQHQQQQQQQHHHFKEELPKDWFYDEMDMNDVDSLEEPKSPADDEYDYDPRYGIKKRRKRRPSKKATHTPGETGSQTTGRRRNGGAGRGRAAPTNAVDTSLSALDSLDSLSGDVTATPTTSSSGSGRRPRTGTGTRGRRRTKASSASACDPPSPVLISEPPSFESAAAAVGSLSDLSAVDEHGELRNYRKFL